MLVDALVVVLLVSGMLATGTVLDRGEVVARARDLRVLLPALSANLLTVPLFAVVVATVLDLDGPVRLGLLLAAASPGGGTGALLSLHARGDAAHAVVLQGVLAVAALVVTPLWVGGSTDGIPLAPVVAGLLVLQLGPLLAGAALRSRRPAVAAAVHPRARRVADACLALLVVGLLLTELDELDRTGVRGLVAMALVVGFCLTTLVLPAAPAVRRATAMTTAVRNLSLALLVARSAPDPDATSLVVLAYGLVMYAATAGAAAALRVRESRA